MFNCANDKTVVEENTPNEKVLDKGGYDAIAAKKYGADEYGMKKYVMAFLKKGPNRDRTKEEAAALQNAHMENIGLSLIHI